MVDLAASRVTFVDFAINWKSGNSVKVLVPLEVTRHDLLCVEPSLLRFPVLVVFRTLR